VKPAGAALRLRPGDAASLCNRGQFLEKDGQFAQALTAFDAAFEADATSYTTCLAFAALKLSIGRMAEALDAFDAAIPLRPEDNWAAQALIVAMNYLPGATIQEIGDVARSLAPVGSSHLWRPFPDLDRSPYRPLRTGYVSADFHNDPVGYFLHSVLEHVQPDWNRSHAKVAIASRSLCASANAVLYCTSRLRQRASMLLPFTSLQNSAMAIR
jgi:protein O-GlcNAc transferase